MADNPVPKSDAQKRPVKKVVLAYSGGLDTLIIFIRICIRPAKAYFSAYESGAIGRTA